MVRQWAEVEGYLAAEYGMTTRQILRETTWRRLRVLLARGFHPASTPNGKGSAEAPAVPDKYAKYGGFNYDAALDKIIGRKTPDPRNVMRMSLDDFMRKVR